MTSDPQGAGVVLHANSNLISATRLRVGSYRVTFPSSLSFCAVVVGITGAGAWDAGAFEALSPSLFAAPSFFGGVTHTESLDVQVRVYGGNAPITGVLSDGLRFNIVVFC